ncbi:hypothetical protein BBP40_001503 [Aspergillus hancockii]|nr:hypothetical protein BBP40_001503 [Aspergillus hancockii]
MSSMMLPSSLPSLTVREAITDALYRCLLGLDTADITLFDSAFTKDASFDLNGRSWKTSNIRVSVNDGDSKASLTTSALAQHYRPGKGVAPSAPTLLVGSLCALNCVKDEQDNLRKIKNWKIKIIWTEGDWEVITRIEWQ